GAQNQPPFVYEIGFLIDNYGRLVCIKNERIHSSKKAPTTAVMNEPQVPVDSIPSKPKTKPPTIAPAIPSRMLMIKPEPEPFHIRLASQPAIPPMIIQPRSDISIDLVKGNIIKIH